MFVYRIAKKKYIRDLSGIGARLYGGRWNRKGIGLIYTSDSRALALVEFLVNVPFSILPSKLYIATVEIANRIRPMEIQLGDLPKNWRDFPPPIDLAEIGSKWAVSNESLLLRVPSAIVPHEFNIIINPSHLDIKHVTITVVEALEMSKRLF
jgi:RES domain-containing protein